VEMFIVHYFGLQDFI